MKCNVGRVDRVLRIIAGVAIVGAGVYYQNWWGAVGIIPIGTALISFCPAYHLIGVSSCKQDA